MRVGKVAGLLLLAAVVVGGGAYLMLEKLKEPHRSTSVNMQGTGMTEKLKDVKTYTNGGALIATASDNNADDPQKGQPYPIGDPYILKYDGVYYLYPSTHFGLADVRAWSSTDLVNWKYEGIVAKDPKLMMAYAPEVHYWNGAFYMVTSPNGQGHYVLKSDSPTGPFTIETDNLGMSIDGTMFQDDDGKWYFFNAGSNGIRGREMLDPYTFGPETILPGTSMNHWTEGPSLIKRNGTYFMMETGNHLMSAGYRVNYSVSHDGPLGPYSTPYNNPIVISTTKDFHGLGHSSAVIGPDLDSYYIAYHNNKNPIAPGVGHDRYLNIDRLAFNGDKLTVLGPTHYAQEAPKAAAFAAWIQQDGLDAGWSQAADGDAHVIASKRQTGGNYTAEFNFKAEAAGLPNDQAYAGAVFGYRDAAHYAMAVVRAAGMKLELVQVDGGNKRSLGTAALPAATDLTKLHSLRIERDHGRTVVYFDGMKKLDADVQGLGAGSIGYVYAGLELKPDYTAFSNDVNGSSDDDAYKPLPGSIEAVHYLQGEGRGYRVADGASGADGAGAAGRAGTVGTGSNPIRPDDHTRIGTLQDHSYYVELSRKGDWLQYNVNVKEAGTYGMDIRVNNQKEAAVFAVYVDDRYVADVSFAVPATAKAKSGTATGWTKVKGAGQLNLPADLHTLKLELVKGSAELMGYDLYPVADKPLKLVYPLSTGGDLPNGLFSDWTYNDRWVKDQGGLRSDAAQTNMAFTGNTAWSDYTLEADVTPGAAAPSNSEGGLLVRVSNESFHKDQVVDGLMGYYVALNREQISLKKLNYSSTVLQTADLQLENAKTHHLKVVVTGSRIQVFVDKQAKPSLDVADANAFTTGKVGIRSSAKGAFLFDNVVITAP